MLMGEVCKGDAPKSVQNCWKVGYAAGYLCWDSHCKFSSIDSESHRQNEACRQVQTKTPRPKKVDDSLVDEVEHVLLLADFYR